MRPSPSRIPSRARGGALHRVAVPALVGLALAVGGCAPKSVEPAAAASAPAVEDAPREEAPSAAGGAESSTPEAPATPGPSATDRTRARLETAVARLTTGRKADTVQARQELEALLEEAPDEVLVPVNLGVARFELGDLEGAAAALSRATRVDPGYGPAWLYLGRVEAALGDDASALRRFQEGLDRAPDDLALHEAHVRALRAAGRCDEAIAAGEQALKVDARSLVVYNAIGACHLEQGRGPLARFVFEKAETLPGAAEDAELQANLGWTLLEVGEVYAAKNRLERAVALDPEYVPGLVRLARRYYLDRDFEGMVPLLERAASKEPDNHGVQVNLGIAYRGVGRFDDAVAAFQRALDLDGSDPTPLFDLGIVLADDLKRYDEAIARFTAYAEAGGAEAERARDYIDDVQREQERLRREQEREARRLERERKKAEREKLLKDAEEADGAPAGGGDP